MVRAKCDQRSSSRRVADRIGRPTSACRRPGGGRCLSRLGACPGRYAAVNSSLSRPVVEHIGGDGSRRRCLVAQPRLLDQCEAFLEKIISMGPMFRGAGGVSVAGVGLTRSRSWTEVGATGHSWRHRATGQGPEPAGLKLRPRCAHDFRPCLRSDRPMSAGRWATPSGTGHTSPTPAPRGPR